MDPSLLINGPHEFNATILNTVPETNPIFILNTSMHTAYVNTAALDRYEPKPDTPDKLNPDKDGILQEAEQIMNFLSCSNLLADIDKDALIAMINRGVDDIFEKASKRGVTYMHDAGLEIDSDGQSKQANFLRDKLIDAKVRAGGSSGII